MAIVQVEKNRAITLSDENYIHVNMLQWWLIEQWTTVLSSEQHSSERVE